MGKLRFQEAKSPVQAGLGIHVHITGLSCSTPCYVRNVACQSQQAELLELQWTLVGSPWAGLGLTFQTLSTFEMP